MEFPTSPEHPAPGAPTLAWLARVLPGPVTAVVALKGGIASSVSAVHTAEASYVLRLWSRPGWADDPPVFTAYDEMRALTMLEGSGLPVPRLVDADPGAAECEFPALLMTWLPGVMLHSVTHRADGAEELTPDLLRQLVEAGNVLHALAGFGLPDWQPYTDLSRLAPPPASTRPRLWHDAIAAAARPAPAGAPGVFLHRDFHPGNTLWRDGRLTGIVDWTNSSRGTPGYDFGYLRANLLLAYGQTAADALLPMLDEHDPHADLLAFFDMYDNDAPPGPLDLLEPYLHSLLRS
ncbi:aminoglycoside phosphotransferase family protein [Catellatospora tritici]|uniref:aminoglycoside phosphotransferase family protein n=1 Tax=Catellatospora tritici TaxID=2851566 RepID=UPI001C2DDAE9|nr:aminoglycoside phosphotransferase family protein [Catellatospora tritici]MBV1852766.1 aminoglycoside phosphotransferase family protein [Catellatospora tritici]